MQDKRKTVLATMLVAAITSGAAGADWPQYRGPNRDGKSGETGLLTKWPAGGPKLLWTADGLGEGWSSAAVVKGQVYVTGMNAKKEYLHCIASDGKPKWTKQYGRAWNRSFPGARTTPTIEQGRVYVISGGGQVVCLNATDGEIRWQVDAFDKFAGKTGNWGTAESALIDAEKIFYTPCGEKTTVVALDKMTGETIWTSMSLNDQSAYVSPILIERGGKKILVTVTARYVVGVNVNSGEILWNYPYAQDNPSGTKESRLFISCVAPLHRDGELFITSGYDHAGILLELAPDGVDVKRKWITETLDCHHGGVLEIGGNIYGSSWTDNSHGNWCCLDWDTGQVKYEKSWNENKGPVIYADGMLYCWDENDGHVALVKATPDGFDVISSFQITVGEGKFWAHPSLSDGRLYLRHGEFLMACDIKEN